MGNSKENLQSKFAFPPVVTVLGHVDHGKTTLLDALRNTSIAKRETGGITQKIGASSIEVVHDKKKRKITLIDTPGHALFSQMRSRGAQAADIGLLVVSAVDGVMPQTKESISVIKQAGIPFIVVFTKSDLPTKNVEKAKQQLAAEEVLLEGMGGDIASIEVSATTNLNMKELLDLILLVWDMQEEKSVDPSGPLQAIVIEARLDAKSGPRATVVVKNGSLHVREDLFGDEHKFRVRTLINDLNQQVREASIGEAVEVLGFEKVPEVGSAITNTLVASVLPLIDVIPASKEMVYQAKGPDDKLAIILRADTKGSLEAIIAALPKDITLISTKTGEVTEADVLLAKSTGGIVLSFNTPIKLNVAKLALTEKVLARNYTIIYEMLDEISDVLEGKKLALIEEIYGQAQVLAKFPYEKTFVLGVKVIEGRVARGDKVRLMRGEEIVGEATLTSLRIGKNIASKVEKGNEAGITISPTLDFSLGDMIISHG